MIGNILGNRYRILREIGSGGMAKVYLAEDINDGLLVAVKILYAHFGEDLSYIHRFNREAKLAGLMNNPHVVKVLDYGSSRDTHYLIMEYVQGKDLFEVIEDRGKIPWEEALSLVDQICQALEDAHIHGIVHRDIKPQNVMLTETGQLKVLDFGIARARMLPSLTQSGFIGSPYYISPEQAMGEEVDIRSDIYSTGIVLYQMLSGHVPFDSKSPWSIISKHIASEFPDINIDDQPVPLQVQALVKQMVAKRPEDRLQTPTAVRQVIAAILAGQEFSFNASTPALGDVDKQAMADSLYHRAQEAMTDEDWQKAVNLLNQAVNLNPTNAPITQQLAFAGNQARLNALYSAAQQALQRNQWQEALDELTEIQETDHNYKDTLQLIAIAEKNLASETEAGQIASLYQQAMTFFEAGNYEQAEKLFAQVKKLNPSYRRVEAMWAETRRRNTQKGSFQRLSHQITNQQTGSALPFPWIIATVVIIVTIIGGIFYAMLNNTPPTPPGPSVTELYAQAETAVAQNSLLQANTLLDQILAQQPNYPQAATLKQKLQQEDILTEQLSQALTAIAAKKWTNAAEILENLRANSTFEPDTVTTLLCDVYLARGKERLTRITTAKDQATIQAAQTDFISGQKICGNRQDLATQITFTENYLKAQQNQPSAETIINALQPIIKAEPDYAGGQAAQVLYQAYLNRGIEREQTGNITGALDDYNIALSLNVADLTQAQQKQADTLQKLSGLSPTSVAEPTVLPDDTPTAEITITPTVTPTRQDPANTSDVKYLAPKLINPAPFASFGGQFTEVILSWEPVGKLTTNEYYDVTIRYFVANEPRYWGSGLIKDTTWRVPVEAGLGIAGNDEFQWWVTVRLGGTAKNGQPDIAVSPPSEERTFIWKP